MLFWAKFTQYASEIYDFKGLSYIAELKIYGLKNNVALVVSKGSS